MAEWFEKVIERVETVQWRVRISAAMGIPADDLIAIINAAITERQADVHRGRNPGEVIVRSTDENTVTRSTSVIIVSYRRTAYVHAFNADSIPDEEPDDDPDF